MLSSIQIAEDFRKHGDQFQDESDEEKESVIVSLLFFFFIVFLKKNYFFDINQFFLSCLCCDRIQRKRMPVWRDSRCWRT